MSTTSKDPSRNQLGDKANKKGALGAQLAADEAELSRRLQATNMTDADIAAYKKAIEDLEAKCKKEIEDLGPSS